MLVYCFVIAVVIVYAWIAAVGVSRVYVCVLSLPLPLALLPPSVVQCGMLINQPNNNREQPKKRAEKNTKAGQIFADS